MEAFEAKVFGFGVVKTDDLVAIHRSDTSGDGSARHVSVSLSAVLRLADREQGVSNKDHNLKEALLARGSGITVEAEHEHILCGGFRAGDPGEYAAVAAAKTRYFLVLWVMVGTFS